MISQADIIRTLVNQNCTDESVMSTALSADCTPPKLLEKLTEAERFDLALDISMKLGLDVTPLWRTWAMRCLKNRNFQGARDKFRHCFSRLRLPANCIVPTLSNLLAKILKELARMDESQISLIDKIESIKQRRLEDRDTTAESSSHETSLLSKPTIYAECKYYLAEYGRVDDRIRFYVKNRLWDEAIGVLLEEPNRIDVRKVFLEYVVPHSSSTGQFGRLVEGFLKSDPDIVISTPYFKAIYEYCHRYHRYNMLYYVQSSIGDFLGAADTQVSLFFLKKPTKNYRELSHRLPNLEKAHENYRKYLDKLKSLSTRKSEEQAGSSLFINKSKIEVENCLSQIAAQMDITRNFALNEVSGCVNSIEPGENNSRGKTIEEDDSPVTLFEKDYKRQTFLAALVLIYFDLSCRTYLSKNGLDLANKLIDDFGLDKLKVYKTAMRIIIEDESCDILENAQLLLERLKEDYLASNSSNKTDIDKATKPTKSGKTQLEGNRTGIGRSSLEQKGGSTNRQEVLEKIRSVCDEVIRDAIGSCREPDYKMELAKLLSSEAKIELYIEHGKLSNAQRLACKMNRPDYVSTIIEEAGRLNQQHVKTVCQLWLAKHETRNTSR